MIEESEKVYRCLREGEEIVTQGADVNALSAEQLEQERVQAEIDARYKVHFALTGFF